MELIPLYLSHIEAEGRRPATIVHYGETLRRFETWLSAAHGLTLTDQNIERVSGLLLSEYEETLDWIERTIQAIKAEREWRVSSSGYFCRFICSVRDHCPIANEIIHARERSQPE